ncbi:hypothetical protein HU200_028232 [Digitaria exilis]|uniref:Uncharacterized protein n=1 Tax=Digitaria exilis TaxID=1010633 RepID=A0A835BV83_9POAL|nr:hypothetical protein HU200_028232 [Digitaria exilis]
MPKLPTLSNRRQQQWRRRRHAAADATDDEVAEATEDRPTMRFSQFPPVEYSSDYDAFMLLRPHSSDGTILHATEGGRTVIYDADELLGRSPQPQKAQRPLDLNLRPDRRRPTLRRYIERGGGHGSTHEVELSTLSTYTQTLDRSRGSTTPSIAVPVQSRWRPEGRRDLLRRATATAITTVAARAQNSLNEPAMASTEPSNSSTRDGMDLHAISATVPCFDAGMGSEPIVFSVSGASGGGEKESLYVMLSTISSPVRDRYSCPPPPPRKNVGSSGGEEDRCSGDFVVLDMNQQPYKWQHLPRPPFVVEKDPYEHDKPDFCIRSSAVIDGGRTIVVSFDKKKGHYGVVMNFTYCFETSTRQWRHAGDWALPFTGRAEYVPELKTWIGFSATSPHHLCSIDLSSAMDAGDRAPPTPQHVWDDFTPPPYTESEVVLNRSYPDYVLRRWTDWSPQEHSLVNLGSGRFCILKVFGISRGEKITRFHEYDSPDVELFAVLTGVEVVRCNDDGEEGGELRMVKHKSKLRRCRRDSKPIDLLD